MSCSLLRISMHPVFKFSSNILRIWKFTLRRSSSQLSELNYNKNRSENVGKLKLNSTSTVDTRDSYHENAYYIENGLRKVYPYYYEHLTYCKGRWVNRKLVEVYSKEFPGCPKEELERRIAEGLLTVNGEKVDQDYQLQNKDLVSATVHRHELAVLATSIKILHDEDDFVVVDKPPSIPVHPCGMYRYNSVVFILNLEMGQKNLMLTHRLDRLTSGILILARNSKASHFLHRQFEGRRVKKEYICRVEGNFPDSITTCKEPIWHIYHKVGISIISPLGKVSETEFEKLSFNGKSSVVICRPRTGRTHQIRVHLQYMGHPIVNDPLYNSHVFGPDKGKLGRFHKSLEQLKEDLCSEHSSQWWLNSSPLSTNLHKEESLCEEMNPHNKFPVVDCNLQSDNFKKDGSRFTVDENCYFCKNSFRDPIQTHLFLCLHAFKYHGEGWEYETDVPVWASANFTDL